MKVNNLPKIAIPSGIVARPGIEPGSPSSNSKCANHKAIEPRTSYSNVKRLLVLYCKYKVKKHLSMAFDHNLF